MPTVWRLIKARYAAHAFDGEGARRYGGRWNSPGVAVAYAADSPASAILEVLVHLGRADILGAYVLVPADVPAELIEELAARDLPPDWRASPIPPATQAVGDAWARAGRSAVLAVPSAIVPHARNYLLNPAHPEFDRVAVGAPERFAFDPRLLGPTPGAGTAGEP